MDKIKNEMMEDIVGQKGNESASKRMSLELERAKLKEKEATAKASLALKSRTQQDELLIKYKSEIQERENQIQQLHKAYEQRLFIGYRIDGIQNKLIMMKAERDKLIDISNELRVELNVMKKQQHQSPEKEVATLKYKGKLDKLKQNYNNLDQFDEGEGIA